MKGKIYALSVVGLLGLFGTAFLVKDYQKPVYQSKDYSGLHNDMGSAKYAIQYREMMLKDENGEINLKDILSARRAVENHYSSKAPADRLFFEEMGPNFVGGRTRGIIQDNQEGNEAILYAGSSGGGVWISYNAGEFWYGYSGDLPNLFIGDVGQTSNGTLFVGTGEGPGSKTGKISSSSFTGDGLFRRAFDGNGVLTYERLIGPTATPAPSGSDWSTIQRVIGHPTDPNKLYVATNRGLMVTNNAQASASEVSFFNGIEIASGIFINNYIDDLAISNDGSTLYATAGGTIYKLNDAGGTNITVSKTIVLPSGNGTISRISVAAAPSNNDIIYAAAAAVGSSNCTYGIFQSKDAGETWNTIGPGAPVSLYQSSACQGFWDNCIAVFPNDAGKIIVGGVSIYKWEESKTAPGTGGWFKIALLQTEGASGSLTDTNYVHADKHRILFTDSNTVYVASDGGIGRSLDGGNTWGQNNNGFNVTQFYSVDAAFGADLDSSGFIPEQVIGGSQDNGTWLVGRIPNRPDNGFKVQGGDGFDAEFSNLASLAFTTSQNMGLRRASFGSGSGNIFDAEIRNICQQSCGTFYSRISYWEEAFAPFTFDSIQFKSKSTGYLKGDILTYSSNIGNIPMSQVLPRDLPIGDSINLPDYAQSKLVIALSPNGNGAQGVYMTRDGANLDEINPSWDLIADASNSVPNGLSTGVFRMMFSADGNQLFLGMTNGSLYRVDNINQGFDSLTLDVRSSLSVLTCTRIMPAKGAYVSSIAVDPNDANNIILTYPGIGGAAPRVYRITNAATCLTDQANDQGIQGDLPQGVPVYSSVISDHNKNTVVVGTEYGVYATDEAFSSAIPAWSEGWGIPKIAVYDMVQQTNRWLWGENGPKIFENTHYRKIYLGTHGRGFWKTTNLTGIDENNTSKTVKNRDGQIQFKVYPNPMSTTGYMEIDLPENKNVIVEIYDLSGKVVNTISNGLMPQGSNRIQFNVNDLKNGTYIAVVRTGEDMKVSKFVVMK